MDVDEAKPSHLLAISNIKKKKIDRNQRKKVKIACFNYSRMDIDELRSSNLVAKPNIKRKRQIRISEKNKNRVFQLFQNGY